MKSEPRYKKGDKIGGRYLIRDAKMGGMGEVYLCRDLEENYPYVLKTFQQRYLADARRLRRAFEQEVATWVALEKHPNIVRCYWMQTLDNQPFMALEWVAGEEGRGTDLRGWLRRGPVGLKLALEIAIDISNGLMHAQMKQPGIVHRDLKPENILMAQGGLAKITDFGLAQIVETTGLEVRQELDVKDSRQRFIQDKGIAGTPAYMAPEQWRGEALDEHTDIYALGVILYEMLTGALPFIVDFAPPMPQQWERWLQTMRAAHDSGKYLKLPPMFTSGIDELLESCLAKAPGDRPTNLTDLITQLTALYRQEFNQAPPMRPAPDVFAAEDYNNRGVTWDALGEHAQALADYSYALDLEPNDANVYTNRGSTYHALQQFDAALADFGHALVLNPKFVHAYNNRGNTYKALKQYESAMDDYNQAIALDATFAHAFANRGSVYHELQDYKAALSDYDYALTLDPNLAVAYSNRGGTYTKLHDYVAALTDFSQALALDPNDASTYSNRGSLYTDVAQYEDAMKDLNLAIDLDPIFAKSYNNRGKLYTDLRDYESALKDLDLALRLNPDYAEAYSNRGRVFQKSHDYEAALIDYRKAIELAPRFADAYLNLGTVFANQGRYDIALGYFENAASLGLHLGEQYANQARVNLAMASSGQIELTQQAFAAFQRANSLEMIQQAVTHFPLLSQVDFIAAIEQAIVQKIPSEQRSAFEQRLAWLRQIDSP